MLLPHRGFSELGQLHSALLISLRRVKQGVRRLSQCRWTRRKRRRRRMAMRRKGRRKHERQLIRESRSRRGE